MGRQQVPTSFRGFARWVLTSCARWFAETLQVGALTDEGHGVRMEFGVGSCRNRCADALKPVRPMELRKYRYFVKKDLDRPYI